jgi:hypothetical protein
MPCQNLRISSKAGQPWIARRVLHNHTAPIRFLSHLPEKPEFMEVSAPCPQRHNGYIDPYLTPTSCHQDQHCRLMSAAD